MNRSTTISIIIGALCLCLFSSMGYTQGDNTMDAMVNLGCIESATITGNAPEDGRGIPGDILWDPSTNDWATELDLHEYGMAFDSVMAATKDEPLWWAVTWPIAKNCGSSELAYKDLRRAVKKGEIG